LLLVVLLERWLQRSHLVGRQGFDVYGGRSVRALKIGEGRVYLRRHWKAVTVSLAHGTGGRLLLPTSPGGADCTNEETVALLDAMVTKDVVVEGKFVNVRRAATRLLDEVVEWLSLKP